MVLILLFSVHPNFEFCLQALSMFLGKDKIILAKIKRKALNLQPLWEMRDKSHKDLPTLGLTDVEERLISGDVIEIYKLLHGLENIDNGTVLNRVW